MAPSQSSRSSSSSSNKLFISSVEQFPFTTSTSSSTSVVGLQRSCGASSKMHRSPSFLLIAGCLMLVTLFMNVSGYAASSVDEHSSKSDSNLSKEEVQLSATSGLVKRSAPSHSSSYGHSIMRFGRAPHNIMHFGKRGGSVAGSNYDLDSYLDQSTDALASDSSSEIGGLGLGAATNSIPEWIINNYLEKLVGGKQQPQHDSGRTMTKYMLVPITVRDPSSSSSFGPSSLTSSSLSANYPNYKGLSVSPIKKAKLSEENDNVFMHFG